MQPLDVSVFKSLKTYYNQEVQCWLRRHPGRPVTEYQIAELFAAAYGKSATVGNAISGFRRTGIVPFNSEIFSDVDFAAAAITEQDVVLEEEAVVEVRTSFDDFDYQPTTPSIAIDDNSSDHQSVSPTFITIPVDGSDDIQQLLLEVIAIPENNYDYQPLVDSSLAVGAGSISSNSDNQAIITVPVGQTYNCIWETSSETITIPVDNSNDCESLTSAITPCPVDNNLLAVASGSVCSNFDHQPSTSAVVTTPGVPVTFNGIIEESQTPYQRSKGAVKRKVAHALNMTSSPYKAELRESKQHKGATKQQKGKTTSRKKSELEVDENIKKKEKVLTRELKKKITQQDRPASKIGGKLTKKNKKIHRNSLFLLF